VTARGIRAHPGLRISASTPRQAGAERKEFPIPERRGAVPVSALENMKDDDIVRVAGAVIVRQRPGNGEGFHLPDDGG